MPPVVLLPVDPVGWDPFVPLRHALLVPSLLALVAIWLATTPHWPRHRIGSLWAGFVAWLFLATASGADRVPAWIGTPERRLGFLAWVLLGASCLIGASTSAEERRWFVRSIAASLVVVAGYTVLEACSLAVDVSFAGRRMGGTLGQPALLGGAAVLCTPVAAALALDRGEAMGWRRVAAIGAGGGLFVLVASASRAAILAGVVVGGVVLVRARSGGRSTRVILAGAAVVLVVGSIVGPAASRLTDLGRGGLSSRADEWRVGVDALVASPLVGYGPEGYRIVFGEHVDGDYVRAHGRSTITDRAHSGPLDVGLIGGIPLTALHLALLLVVVAAAWRAMVGEVAVAGLSVGVLAYAVHQLGLFPLADLDALFWLAAGMVVGACQPRSDVVRVRPAVGRVGAAAVGLAAIVAAVAGAREVVADHRVDAALARPAPLERAAAADRAADAAPWSFRYAFVAARLWSAVDGPDGVRTALARIDAAASRSPEDPAVRGEIARLRLELARRTGDPRDVTVARATLEQVVAVDPLDPRDLVLLGIAAELDGDLPSAVAAWTRAADLGDATASELLASVIASGE